MFTSRANNCNKRLFTIELLQYDSLYNILWILKIKIFEDKLQIILYIAKSNFRNCFCYYILILK